LKQNTRCNAAKSAAQLAQRSIANVLVITNNTYLIAQRLFCYFAVTALT
jgi:uncharacterized SAM-binding protein YcdF (DUF218 family)